MPATSGSAGVACSPIRARPSPLASTNQRLRSCVDTLAREAFGDDDEDGVSVIETPPQRPNPVTQAEMDAGSIELF
jgi:hypothetical protein